MEDHSLFDERAPQQWELLVTSLKIMAAISAGAGTLAGVGVLSQAALRESLDLDVLLQSVIWILGGWVTGCALWAISWIVGALARQPIGEALPAARSSGVPRLDDLAMLTAAESDRKDAAERDRALLQRIADEVAGLREDMSLSPAERAARAENRRRQQLTQSLCEIESAIGAGQFVLAQERLAHLSQAMPEAPDAAGLRVRLAEARATAEAQRVAKARATVDELMSMAAFDKAIAEAEGLARQLPDSVQAAELVERTRREADTFARQQREKLYLQVTRATEMHHWRAALEGARQLARLHAGSVEADEVVAQMELLTENARIEEVRDRRDRISDMIQRRRYRLAVELAEDVIAHYPDTQAAMAFTEQMDRLRELAAKEKSS